MTHFILILLFPILGLGGEPSMSEITTAIQKGDATTLGAYFDSQVELSVLNKEASCNPNQATQMVKAFFQKYQPKAFSQVHQGKSSGNETTYCIGNLKTQEKTFRVYIYLKADSAKKRIQELRFEVE